MGGSRSLPSLSTALPLPILASSTPYVAGHHLPPQVQISAWMPQGARRLNIPSIWIVYIARIRDRTHTTTYLPKTVLGILPFVIHSISYLAEQVCCVSRRPPHHHCRHRSPLL